MASIYDINGKQIVVSSSGSYSASEQNNIRLILDRVNTLENLHDDFILPEVRFYGDMSNMTKDKSVNITVVYNDGVNSFETIAKTKWQGATSVNFPKKNYNMKFIDGNKNKIQKVFKNWYPTDNYHLKANYFDYSMVRNCVGTRLGRMVYPNQYPNNAMGSIDSFPCVLYINDVWHGCYTWNLPQDAKIFNMDEDNDNHLAYRMDDGNGGWNVANFEDRVRDESSEVHIEKVTRMVDWAYNSTLDEFSENIKDYFDIDSLRYYWAMADLGCCWDSMSNNSTWASWDGVHWYCLWYDVDQIFGIDEDEHPANQDLVGTSRSGAGHWRYCPVWDKLEQTDMNGLSKVYKILRDSTFTDPDTIIKYFTDYRDLWGEENLAKERQKWPYNSNVYGHDARYDITTRRQFIIDRLAYCDSKYGYSS